MRIGVPKEIKIREYRVGLTPTNVRELVAHGHEVVVERNAGAGIGMTDRHYEAAGARIAADAASVFADGLLFMSGEALPLEMHRHGPTLSRIRRRLAEARVDPMQATLAYAMGLPEVSAVVASIASAAELRAVVAAAHAPTPALDWASMQLDPATIAADSRRISSAA